MPSSAGLGSLSSSASAATIIQSVFRRYKVQLSFRKAKILFNDIHSEIETSVGQCSSFLFPIRTPATSETVKECETQKERDPENMILSQISCSGDDSVLPEKPREKLLEELLAEERWLEQALLQRMQGIACGK